MPSIRSLPGPYRVSFFSADCRERRHVHVRQGNGAAKFWLEPGVELFTYAGFSQPELRAVARLLAEHRAEILGQIEDFCRHAR